MVTEQLRKTYRTILILEDDRDALEEITEALSDEGFLTLSAQNFQAVEVIKQNKLIDLLLID